MKLRLTILVGAVLLLVPLSPASAEIICIDGAPVCCGTVLGKEVLPINC